MRCSVCRYGVFAHGHTTVTLERGSATLVFKRVPAQVCDNCGEAYVDEAVSAQLLAAAEAAVRAGVQVEVREFAA